MAVADSDYKFVFIYAGSYGKDCDPSIFKKTKFWSKIVDSTIGVPDSKCLGGRTDPVPYVVVGEDVFGLHKHLLKPFGETQLNVNKRIFNYRLCRARRYVECTFGILTIKWRVFDWPLNISAFFACNIITACYVLRDFVWVRDGYDVEDTYVTYRLENLNVEDYIEEEIVDAHGIREQFIEYFISQEGFPFLAIISSMI